MGYGAGIYNDHAKLALENCTFNQNIAERGSSSGGAIYNDALNQPKHQPVGRIIDRRHGRLLAASDSPDERH